MSQLMDSISQSLGGDTLKQIGGQLGTNEATTQAGITAALPMLLAGLARNSASPEGASALHGALSKDHDGSILDNLSGFLGNAQSGPGAGILGHLLGERQPVAQEAVAKTSGLDLQRSGQLLVILAPIVMGMAARIFDKDGDGSITDEVGGFVGKLFGGR